MKVEHDHVLTDVTKVKEIFVNILSNAMKYTPSGGSVTVSLEELPCDEPGYMIVRTRISDTGIGMSQDYLTRIFEAFTVNRTPQRANRRNRTWNVHRKEICGSAWRNHTGRE